MWSKLSTLVLTALFLLVVCSPVASHDGKTPSTIEASDEQPWGGEHYNEPIDDPLEAYPDLGSSSNGLYFIKFTISYGWFSLRHIIDDVLELEAKSGKTGQTLIINQAPGDANNQDQVVGTR